MYMYKYEVGAGFNPLSLSVLIFLRSTLLVCIGIHFISSTKYIWKNKQKGGDRRGTRSDLISPIIHCLDQAFL